MTMDVAPGIRFDGRVAVVTGAGNGLGRSYARALAARGARVVVNDLGGSASGSGASRAVADEVVEEIRADGGDAVASHDSVATRTGGQAIIETAVDTYGRLDILISNAGILRNGRFEDLTDEQIDAVLDVHLKGAFHVAQPAYRAMRRGGYGRILFASSSSALFGHPWQANYAAAKAGLVGLVNVISLEGQAHGVHCNAILPTAATRLAGEMTDGWTEVADVSSVAGRIDFAPFVDRMQPGQNTPLAVYLVSERCTSTHGLFSAVAGRYAQVVIGHTEGWAAPGLAALASPEEVDANWDRIVQRRELYFPQHNYEEIETAFAHIRRASGVSPAG